MTGIAHVIRKLEDRKPKIDKALTALREVDGSGASFAYSYKHRPTTSKTCEEEPAIRGTEKTLAAKRAAEASPVTQTWIEQVKRMTVTSARTTNVTPSIDEEAELGFGALLIAESEDGGYEPIGLVSTTREARKIAALNLASRMKDLEKGGDPMCPARSRCPQMSGFESFWNCFGLPTSLLYAVGCELLPVN